MKQTKLKTCQCRGSIWWHVESEKIRLRSPFLLHLFDPTAAKQYSQDTVKWTRARVSPGNQRRQKGRLIWLLEYGHNHCNAWLSMKFLLCMCKRLGLTLILVTWQCAASIGCFTYFLKAKLLSFYKQKKYTWTNSKHAFFSVRSEKETIYIFFLFYVHIEIYFFYRLTIYLN